VTVVVSYLPYPVVAGFLGSIGTGDDHGWSNLATPPAEIAGLMIRSYWPLVSLNKVLLNLYFWQEVMSGGGRLTSHDWGMIPVFYKDDICSKQW